MDHQHNHKVHRSGWLRAAVLGANDGLVSTASLIIGVTAAGADHGNILIAGLAGGVAGAMSMAAGEYVSVSSQADIEKADLELERKSLRQNPESETRELTEIYRQRGLTDALARQVAEQLMNHDALEAHARDEIGITTSLAARPIQAAISSAIMFAVGAALPLALAWLLPSELLIIGVAALSLFFLAVLGGLAAIVGGAPVLRAALRVCFWGALAMLITAATGYLFDVAT